MLRVIKNKAYYKHLHTQLAEYTKVIYHLEEQNARQGSHTPPHVLMDKQTTQDKISLIYEELYPTPPSNAHKAYLWTRSQGNKSHKDGKKFDWTRYFEHNATELTPEQNQELQQEIAEYIKTLDCSQNTQVALEVSAHFPAALAFGKAFSSQSRYSLWVLQESLNSPELNQWWHSKLPYHFEIRDVDYIQHDLITVKQSDADIYSIELSFIGLTQSDIVEQ